MQEILFDERQAHATFHPGFPMNISSKDFLITDFSNLSHQRWQIVNDSVMGGKSEGGFQINSAGHAIFLGHVSLENNGGFTMVKNHEPLNLTGYSTIRLQVLGDGKRYSFRLQTGESRQNMHAWSYENRFNTTAGEWADIQLNLKDFIPVYRGRTQTNVPPPDFSNIYAYAILISDQQEGDFRLEIKNIIAQP